MEITNMSGYTYKFNSNLIEATEFDYTFNFICNNEKYTRILFSPTDALLYFKENGDIIPALTILDGVYEWVDTSYMSFDIIDGEDVNNIEAIQTLSLYGEFILTQDEQDITISGKYKWNNTLQMPTDELIFKDFIANNKKFTENVLINNTNDVCSVVVSNTGECLYFNDKGWLDGSLTYSQLLAGSDGISSDIYQIWDFGNGVTIKLKAYKYLIANATVYSEEETKQVVMTLKDGLVLETLNNELFLLQQSNYDVDLPIKFNLYIQGVLIDSFEFEYNMTWEEFVNSKYNIDNEFYVKENDDKVYYIRDNYVIENQTKDSLILEQDYSLLELEPPAEDDEPIIPEEPEIPDEPTTPTKLNFIIKVDGALDGIYSFDEGMNWLQFIESEYNANGLFSIKTDDNYVYYREEFIVKNVIYTSIIENKEYDTFKETIDEPEKPDIPSDSIARLKKLMTNIADSIRYKTNSNKSINAQKFSDEILDIKTGIEVSGTLDITANGTHDVSKYASANVNVESSGGAEINGIIEQYKVNAGATVKAGDFVEFVQLFKNNTIVNDNVKKIKGLYLTDNILAIVYLTSTQIRCSIVSITSNEITPISDLVLWTFSGVTTNDLDVDIINSKEILVAYATSSDVRVFVCRFNDDYSKCSSTNRWGWSYSTTQVTVHYMSDNLILISRISKYNDTDSDYWAPSAVFKYDPINFKVVNSDITNSASFYYTSSSTSDVKLATIKLDNNHMLRAQVLTGSDQNGKLELITLGTSELTKQEVSTLTGVNKFLQFIKIDDNTYWLQSNMSIYQIKYTNLNCTVTSLLFSTSPKQDQGFGGAVSNGRVNIIYSGYLYSFNLEDLTCKINTISDMSITDGNVLPISNDSSFNVVYGLSSGAGVRSFNVDSDGVVQENELNNTVTVQRAKNTLYNVGIAKTGGSEGETIDVYKAKMPYQVFSYSSNVTTSSEIKNMFDDETQIITVTANEMYVLPETITVTGCEYTWNSSTGELTLLNPTSDVNITIEAIDTRKYTESATQTTAGTSLTASVNCNVGDLVVCAIATRDTLNVSEGWTLVSTSNVNSVDTSSKQRLSWAYKYAESTTESITVTQASAQRLYINMIALQGATGVTDNGYTYSDTTETNQITATKPSGLVLWGMTTPIWSTSALNEGWKSSYEMPIIEVDSSLQQRLGIGVDQTDETSVTFTAASTNPTGMTVGCLTVQGMDKFYD